MGKQVPWLTSPTSLADSETQINGRKVTKNINKHKHKNSRQNKRCLDYHQLLNERHFISPYCNALSLSTQQRRNSSKVKVKLDSKVGCQLMAQCSCPILADVLLETRNQRAPEAEAIFKQHSTVGEQRGGASIAGGCTTTTSRHLLVAGGCTTSTKLLVVHWHLLVAGCSFHQLPVHELLLPRHMGCSCCCCSSVLTPLAIVGIWDSNLQSLQQQQKLTQITQTTKYENTHKFNLWVEKTQTNGKRSKQKEKEKTQTQCRKKCKWSIWGATSRSRLQSWDLRLDGSWGNRRSQQVRHCLEYHPQQHLVPADKHNTNTKICV